MSPGWTWPLTKQLRDQPSPVDAAVMSIFPWSQAGQSPALLEGQWKAMIREESDYRMEERSPGQVEGASDLQVLVWSPSDGGQLHQPTETLATADWHAGCADNGCWRRTCPRSRDKTLQLKKRNSGRPANHIRETRSKAWRSWWRC